MSNILAIVGIALCIVWAIFMLLIRPVILPDWW